MKKNTKSGLVVLIVLVIAVLGLSLYNLTHSKSRSRFESYIDDDFSISASEDEGRGIHIFKKTPKKYIGALYIQGTIEAENSSYNQKWVLSVIDQLKKDPKNEAMALFINSPGGAVYQADEVYLALQDYKTTGKKIYVYQGPLAASGGYYISCAANKIYANRNTLTGSIGVISGSTYDLTGLFNNLGIKSETIHAGKNKNMGNFNEPFTNEQREIMQAIADECYDQFTSIVSTQRNLPMDKVRKLADGRIYTAKQALENGLIDSIDTWNNMIFDLKKEINNGNDDFNFSEQINVVSFKYEKKKSFWESMLYSFSSIKECEAASKLGIPQKVLQDINNFHSYPAYLYQN